jgi:hypothetical protein
VRFRCAERHMLAECNRATRPNTYRYCGCEPTHSPHVTTFTVRIDVRI